MPPAPRSAARNAQALTDAPKNAKVRVSQVLTHSSGALTELLSADKWLRLCQAAQQSFPRPDQPERRAIGCTAEQTSCTNPGSVNSAECAPPPIDGWASNTVTANPARARTIAA